MADHFFPARLLHSHLFKLALPAVLILGMTEVWGTQTQVAAPTLKTGQGTTTNNIVITVSDATAGATLYYTTNGAAPSTNASAITSGQTVTITQGATLKVQGYLGGSLPSTVVVATYAVQGALSASGHHTLALKSDGTLWGWGNNANGQLGIGSTNASTNVSLPLQISYSGTNTIPVRSLISRIIAYENGLSIPWEITYFGTTGNNPYSNSSAGDGYTYLQESQLQRNPNDYYQGLAPVVQIVGGNNQTGPSGSILPQPLVVQILNGSGVAQSNAPVSFAVSGGGSIGYGTNINQSSITLRTDAGGLAQVICQLPTGASATNQVSVTAGLALPLIFSESISSTNVPSINFQISGTNVAPATLSFSSTITSPSSVTNVSYYEGSTLLASSTNSPYSLTLSNVTAGLHIYSAIAQNAAGYSGSTNVSYSVSIPAIPWASSQFTSTNISAFYVDSVDQLQGVRLPTTNAFTTTPWVSQIALPTAYGILYASNAYGSISSDWYETNPLAAFGAAAGGNTLYTGNTYTFAFCEGGLSIGSTNFTVYTNPTLSNYNASDFQILVYKASQFPGTNVAAAYTNYFSIPHQGDSNWAAFQNGGFIYTNTFSTNGSILTTTVAYNLGGPSQGYVVRGGTNAGYPSIVPLIIKHTATGASNYYVVNYRGVYYDSNNTQFPLTVTNPANASNSATYNYGYTLDFTDRLPWISTSLTIPTFQGQPLPAAYAGMSLDELLNVSSTVTNQFASPSSTNYTALDGTPELRTNPVLDKFVSDMGSNPIVLANFVLNQIHLSDAISYNTAGVVSDQSINEGGISRSALGTFLEREGNPAEQCALLVYLLRKCGVPCGYVFPNHNSLLMLDARMSALLRVQLGGALTQSGTGPQLLPVNYPWVAAYINNQWVHIFPWMKDTEITEGDNLNDYLPAGYNTGLGWLQHYINRDTNILALSSQYDNPGVLFPLFVSQQLASNGLTTGDVGLTILDRQHNYNSWSDFPQPWSLASNSLSSSNLVTSLGSNSNIFNTMQCQIFSDQGTNIATTPILDTGKLRMSDLHNRRIMLRTDQTASTLTLSLEPMRPGATNAESFPAGGLMVNKQSMSANLTTNDDNLRFRIIYNRNQPLASNFNSTNTNSIFLGVSDTQQVTNDRPLRKGDAAVLCLDYGRVTQQMLDVQAQNFWAAQQAIAANTNIVMDADTALGTPLYLAGMTYYKNVSDFRQTVEALEKQNIVSFFANGFSKISPQRTSTGALSTNGGVINLVYPNVDMLFQNIASIGNATVNPSSGVSYGTGLNDWLYILIGEISAQEHTVLNTFYNVSDSASTVHLLHDAQIQGKGIITLNSTNFTAAGNVNYNVGGTNQSLKAWAGASMWASITNTLAPYAVNGTNVTGSLQSPFALTYITPGPILCASNAYLGMGAFVLNPGNSAAALISGNMTNAPVNGGYASYTPVYVAPAPVYNVLSYTPSGYSYSPPPSSPAVYQPPVDNNYINQATAPVVYNTLASSFNATTSYTPTATLGFNQYNQLFNISTPTPLSQPSSGWTGQSIWQNFNQVVADPVNVIRGDYYINDNDLTLPGPMPISFSRNYDSLDLAGNEFGTGWKLGYFAYIATVTNSSLLYAAEKDGSVIAYSPKSGTTNTWIPAATNNPTLSNQKGDAIGSLANPFNNTIVVSGSGTNATYTLTGSDGSVRTFVVASYPLAGTNNITRQRPYLKTWVDPQSNSLSFSFGTNSTQTDYGLLNRISASNGNFLQLNYDTFGHIITANAADGRRVAYSYDNYGDLVSVTRPDASVVSYAYSHQPNTGTNATGFYSEHLLTKETKPEGRLLVNTYDSSRRVTQQQATVGTGGALIVNASFNYSSSTNSDGTITGTTTITDANSGHTTYAYAGSQITGITDQNGHSIQQSWYTNSGSGAYQRSLSSKTDKRGLTTAYSYDTSGNLVSSTVTGTITASGSSDTAVTAITYNSLNLPTRITQPNGNYQSISYSGSFPYLPTAIQQNAAGGGLIQETDNSYSTVGSVGTTPFAAGVLSSTSTGIPGTGDLTAKTFTYNSQGFPTSETDQSGSSDPSLTTQFTYNLRGQLIQKTDSIGRVTKEAYDDLGNHIWEELFDAKGNAVDWHTWYYGQNGDLQWTQGARFSPADITQNIYDAGGRLSQHIVWTSQASGAGVSQKDQATTTYTHDGYGNLTKVLDPLGNVTTMTRDPVGQLLSSTTAGATDGYSYTAGGDVATHTNPLGGVTTTSYNQQGQPLSQTNPDGTVTTWTYLIDGRPSGVAYGDGSRKSFAYNDGAHSVSTTWTGSGSSGVIITSQTTDSRGNVVSSTDGNGYTTTASYDGLGRLKSSTGPAGANGAARQQETHVYDAAGVTDTKTDAAGNVTVTTRDAIGRPTSVTVTQGGSLIRSHSISYSPDHQSFTTMEGNGTAITTTWTDLAGKPVLSKKADGGTITSVYDDNENLLSTTDELGRTTSASYDGLNRPVTQTLPDNAVTSLGYDAGGNLTSRAMPGGLTWHASYDTAGRETSEYLSQGGNTTRTYSYSYKGTGVAGAGKVATKTDPRGIVSSFVYDGFSRVSQISANDSVAGLTQNFSYDNDSQLLAVAQSYQNTSNPSSLVKRTYDPYGNIATEQVFTNSVLKDIWTQTHDALGHRTSLAELNNPSFPYSYTYRGDGLLTGTSFNGGGYSYAYGNDGLLISRTTPVQTVSVMSRDPVGRLKELSQSFYGNFVLDEKMAYNLNGQQSGYTAQKNFWGAQQNLTFTEPRPYFYDTRGHLIQEGYVPHADSDSITNAANVYQFDGNASGGLGLRTQEALYTLTNTPTQPTGVLTQNYPQFARLGSAQAGGSLSGIVAPSSTNTINSYDAAGNLTSRAPSSGTSGATDTLTYDAFNRLIGVTRAGSSANFTWSAVYDGLGRRLATVQVPSGGTMQSIQSSYDPEHEFEEIAVTVGSGSAGQRNWFIHGPDLDGTYGGMQGTGGTEAVYNSANGYNCSTLNDVYGNSVFYVVNYGGGYLANWNPVYCSAFGPMYQVTPIPINGSYILGILLNYRGHYVDGIGSYHLGQREYQHPTGTFTTADPLGHTSTPDLYQFCNGDPINNFDPDGRLSSQVNNEDHGILSLSQGAPQKDLQITPIVGPSSQEVVQASSSSLTPFANLNLQTPVSNSDDPSGATYDTVSQATTTVGMGATALSSSPAKIGDNAKIYWNGWGGNGSVATTAIGPIADAFGRAVGVAGIANEAYGYLNNNVSGSQAAANVGVGLIGIFGGPYGAAFAIDYSLIQQNPKSLIQAGAPLLMPVPFMK